jgi:hypothetical protein
MIKSVFVSPLRLEEIDNSGVNHLIVVCDDLNQKMWNKLKEPGVDLSITITAFGTDGCPGSLQSREKLFIKLKNALKFKPKQIWIDHFRFDGRWEAREGSVISKLHKTCEFCQGKSRVFLLKAIAEEVMNLVQKRAKVGYFAVPFTSEDTTGLADNLGQNHRILGRVFDISSPMLYQQMLGKPTTYISDYVKFLANQTQKPVLPIIQVKSMPDNLKDTITEDVIISEFREAIKEPSIGVCFFCWDHALEKNKTDIIKKLLSSHHP